MVELAILVRNSTLAALREHSTHPMADPLPLNERESLVLLSADVVQRLLSIAWPEDARIDDVIMRLAL